MGFYVRAAVCALALFGAASTVVQAADEKPFKIGVLADMSGLYADMTGTGSVRSVELAVETFGGNLNGRKIVVVQADHQNKPDIASALARRWFTEEGVDVVVNAAGSAVALAVVEMAKSANKAALVTGAVTDRLSNDACSPNHVHYGLDNRALVSGTIKALIAKGKKNWFLIVADYAFGNSFLAEATRFIEGSGGKVVGVAKHPLNASDFASYLLQAQASGADVVGLANAGSDMTSTISQAQEFGLTRSGRDVAAMIMFLTDVHAMGLERAKGTLLTTASYWDMDDASRAFAERFHKSVGRMPSFYQEADYSATLAYLAAASKVRPDDGKAVIAAMKGVPIHDSFARGGMIREDGLLVHDVFLARVKTPQESKRAWDYYEVVATIPGEAAFRPLSESTCPMVKK
jgi:branched-chain amino acid transport system substrate-binding protein